jgi:hypothetical protein
VRRQLRREVGFGCPIPGCGIPYLSWHHFDPPWREERHHRPDGLVALCLTHAGQADANAFDADYLRELKHAGRPESEEVRGQLSWMRRRILVLAGGNWYYDTPVPLQIGSTDAIALTRDADGYLLLNLRMPSTSGQPRVRIEGNYITVGRDHVADIDCATRGRTIRITYPNGDQFSHEYRDVESEDELRARYGQLVGPQRVHEDIIFPLTVVEVSEKVASTTLEFGPTQTLVAGTVIRGCWSISNRVGVGIGVTPEEENLLFGAAAIVA